MNRKMRLVPGLILFFASSAFAQEPTPAPSPAPKPAMTRSQSQKTIIATERKLWEAWKNADLKPYKAYLSADSVMIGDSGVANKTDSMNQMSIRASRMQCAGAKPCHPRYGPAAPT